MCRYKNVGVAGYAEAFMPVQSDLQTSEWYSYFENDVLVSHFMLKQLVQPIKGTATGRSTQGSQVRIPAEAYPPVCKPYNFPCQLPVLF